MSREDLIKLTIALSGAFAGWILAQFASILKTVHQRWKVKRLLLEELRDLDTELTRILRFFARQIELHGAGGIGNTTIAGLTNPIFSNYYKDALLALNHDQRISFQLINSLLNNINTGIAEFKEITRDIQEEHMANGMSESITKAGQLWGDKIKAEYHHAANLQWHVRLHLNNKSGPDLSPNSPHNRNYLAHRSATSAKVEELLESGSKKSIEGFKGDP